MNLLCPLEESISKKCKHYNPKALFDCEAEKCEMIGVKMPEEKIKDYKAILKERSLKHSMDYLFGYITCLKDDKNITLCEGMELVDYAVELINKKGAVKS